MRFLEESMKLRNKKDDRTVRTRLDADKLDLGRIGVNPKPEYLLTKAALAFNRNNS